MEKSQPWKTNYKAMNVEQLKRQVATIKANPHKYSDGEARLAYIATELAIKVDKPAFN